MMGACVGLYPNRVVTHRTVMPTPPFTSGVAWIMLLVAGVLEVGWAIGIKYTQGFTKLTPTALTLAALAASFVLLAQAARVIPIGTAYAVWTGIGACGAAALGMVLFKEPATVGRIACLALIVGGVVGLKVLSPAAATP